MDERIDIKSPKKPYLYDFSDFRAYLEAYFVYLKAKSPKLSKRQWSANIHYSLADGSQISRVLNGRKNASTSLVKKLIEYFGFTGTEMEYFQNLVAFNQSTSPKEKTKLFEKLSQFKNSFARQMNKKEYKFFKEWYFPPIWSYLSTNPKNSDAKQIATALGHKVSVPEIKQALEIMLQLGLIVKVANGFKVTGEHVRTPEELKDITLMEYNKQFLQKSIERLEEVDAAQRQYNTMVISCSQQSFEEIKVALQKFQDTLRMIVSQDQNETQVYALGMQLFPYISDENLS